MWGFEGSEVGLRGRGSRVGWGLVGDGWLRGFWG